MSPAIFKRRAEYVPLMQDVPWLLDAVRKIKAVNARHRAGELTREEADRQIDAIVQGVE